LPVVDETVFSLTSSIRLWQCPIQFIKLLEIDLFAISSERMLSMVITGCQMLA
jgi:hypothetical protein